MRLPFVLRSMLAPALPAIVLLAACADTPAEPDLLDTEPFGTVHGRVVAPGMTTFADLQAKIVWGDQTVSAPVATDGTFDVVIPDHAVGLGTLTLEPGVFAPVHPSWALVSTDDLDGGRGTLVLAPKSWTIEAGDYAGQEQPIDPEMAADTRVMPSFWGFFYPYTQDGFLQNVTDQTLWTGEMRSWPSGAYPIPVALDRDGSDQPISAADSVVFWEHVERMEAALGFDAFRPVALDDVQILGGSRRADQAIIVLLQSGQPNDGMTTVSRPQPPMRNFGTDARTWSGNLAERVEMISADIVYGVVSFDSAERFADQRLVIHELMHTLGAGHGCSWASVQTYCASLQTDVPTPADVAHLRAMLAVRDLEAETGSRFGLFASVIGHRAVTLGLSPVPSIALIYGPASAPSDWR